MASPNVKALLISVGNETETVIFTVNRLRPEGLCFFVSEETKGLVDREIIPKIENPPRQWSQITTPDPEDLRKCCEALIHELPGLLSRWEAEPSQVVVDYTGGTRTMAAALALGAVGMASGYHYIGDTKRASGGTAVSVGETERAVYRVNPWDALAAGERREAAAFFNRGRYPASADLFQKIENRVSGGEKPLYRALSNLALGYAHWDALEYRSALMKLQESRKALEMATVFGGPPGLAALVSAVKENSVFLEKLAMGAQETKPELYLDLLANAERRARFEQKYEDATVRLYRALEALAQVRLAQKGIRSAAVDPAKIPEPVRKRFQEKYTSELDGKIKLDLLGAYRLLKEMGDELGKNFEKQWNNLKTLLEARYESVLAHGFTPIKPERYQQIWEAALKLSETPAQKLPQFPRMEF